MCHTGMCRTGMCHTGMCHTGMCHLIRMLHKHLPDCPGASESQIRASTLKDQEIIVAQLGKLVDIWLSIQNKSNFSFGGNRASVIRAIVFIKFVLFFTCPNGQVVIKAYVALWFDHHELINWLIN